MNAMKGTIESMTDSNKTEKRLEISYSPAEWVVRLAKELLGADPKLVISVTETTKVGDVQTEIKMRISRGPGQERE